MRHQEVVKSRPRGIKRTSRTRSNPDLCPIVADLLRDAMATNASCGPPTTQPRAGNVRLRWRPDRSFAPLTTTCVMLPGCRCELSHSWRRTTGSLRRLDVNRGRLSYEQRNASPGTRRKEGRSMELAAIILSVSFFAGCAAFVQRVDAWLGERPS